jgi:hypothetical protein
MTAARTLPALLAAAALTVAGLRAPGLGAPARADEVALGSIRIETPSGDFRGEEFRRNVMGGLRAMQDKSPHLARLLKAAQEAPFPITVQPMMEDHDPSVHVKGNLYRPHVRPVGYPSFGRGGVLGIPTNLSLTVGMVNPHWMEYKRGALAHELVHAVDFAYGRWNSDRLVAERRAMFMENVWRDAHGWRLAEHYTDQKLPLFETLEYQRAKGQNAVARCVEMLLSVSSFACP